MKKNLFFVSALTVLLAVSCSSETTSKPGWGSKEKKLMKETIGEVLPYVAFDKTTYDYEYEVDEIMGGMLYFFDQGSTTVFKEDYGAKLIKAGYEKKSYFDEDVEYFYYSKATKKCEYIDVSFGFEAKEGENDEYFGNYIGVEFSYVPPTEFPVDYVKKFFSQFELTVTIPKYEAASKDAYFEVSYSMYDPYYLDIYPTNSSSEELVAYKNLLKQNGWTVVSEDEETSEDFKLRFGNTLAFVDLIDYTSYASEEESPYVLVSFYYAMPTAKKAISEICDYLEVEYTDISEDAGYPMYAAAIGGPATKITIAQFKTLVEEHLVLDGFKQAQGWTPFQMQGGGINSEACVYICLNTVYLTFSVYQMEVQSVLQTMLQISAQEPYSELIA